MNKQSKVALSILVSAVVLSIAIYVGLKWYFNENPIVVCGDDKYSRACLVSYARDLKINQREFITCIDGNSTDNIISEDIDAAQALGMSSAPALFVGQASGTDNSTFVGFFVYPSSADELKTVANNLLDKGIGYAKEANLAAVKTKVNKQVEDYLKSKNYAPDKYASELARLQPSLKSYFESFELFSLKMNMRNVQTKGSSQFTFLYFADYGSQYTPDFSSVILTAIKTEYIDTGKMKLVVKEMPLADDLGDSSLLSKGALCAGKQNKYFEYSDILNSL